MVIYLLGFMGSGKTTAGKKLAAKLGWEFKDLDKHIEDKLGTTINEIFEGQGEEEFRRIETEELISLSTSRNLVLSCGGGTPCFNNNISLMNESGHTIYLRMSVKALKSRLLNSKSGRPLIKDLDEKELEAYIKETLSVRESYYMKSKGVVDALNLDIRQLSDHLESQGLYNP